MAWVAAAVEVPLTLGTTLLPLAVGLPPYGQGISNPPSDADYLQALPRLAFYFLALIVVEMVAGALLQGALVLAAARLRDGQPAETGPMYKEAWRRWPSLVGVAVLVGLMILGLVILISIPVLIAAVAAVAVPGAALTVLAVLVGLAGLAGVIAVALWVAARYAVASVVVMLEGRSALDALRRSARLGQGHLRQNAALILLAFLAAAAAGLAISLPLSGLSAVAGPEVSLAVQGIAQAVVASVVGPIGAVAAIEIYRELLARAAPEPGS